MNNPSETGSFSNSSDPSQGSSSTAEPTHVDSASLDLAPPSDGDGNEPRRRMTLLVAFVIAAWTASADWLIYRTHGFSGPAVFFMLAPLFILATHWKTSDDSGGSANNVKRSSVLLCFLMLLIGFACLRLATVGTGWVIGSAVLLTMAFGLALSGAPPWAAESMAMMFWAPLDGIRWLLRHRLPSVRRSAASESVPGASIAWLIPLVATVAFATLFVLANPDLLTRVTTAWNWASDWTWKWLERIDTWEAPFCALALLMGVGLFFPLWGKSRIGGIDRENGIAGSSDTALLSVAYRNMLLCLNLLFAVYLVFEFQTLYKREFPEGFYYAGYAHEGAAWLTVALLLATVTLSVVFRGTMFQDRRIMSLKKLAWIWSAMNLLLAVSVYNRLMIYVGYNGLTWMRIVGFFGTTIVVAGFILVLIKIAYQKGFWWLLRSQSTAFVLGIMLLTIFPSDWVTHRYNTARVLSGYLHPSVMVAVKEKDEFGYLAIIPLVDAEDPVIREGVRAILAERQLQIEQEFAEVTWHWTMFQWSTDRLYKRLASVESQLLPYLDNHWKREHAITTFEDYAMKWY
ncbi:DUF4153 domain-containing protein [Roseiconus lacunae]|uniref:DUF4173 domain-containing protein n=1 Tax=Roseiconus lacunae TaxID=2605694 RepID=A0ABT7PCK0_9BACT|nr:DUF4153 domain-containing protein [Roseiconus lacunae]MDM4014225.1 DUF4173 domain-containing protein [Roseiconus lacunae]